MNKLIVGVMALMAVVLAFGALNAPTAQAKPTDVVVISASVLQNLTGINATDGISSGELTGAGSIDKLAGDDDGKIEATDLEAIDLDANQLNEHSNGASSTAEAVADCADALDSDSDGLINDGCAAGGAPTAVAESGTQCDNNTDDEDNDTVTVGTQLDGLVNDGCPAAGPVTGGAGEGTFVFVFVDDDEAVTLDPKELDSIQNGVDADDGAIECGAVAGPGATDADFIDADCDNNTIQGDNLVIFHLMACGNLVTVCEVTAAQVESGDDVNVEATQNSIIESATIAVVGDPDEIEIVEVEETLSTEDEGCTGSWDDDNIGDDLDKIVLASVVTDADGTELTGVDVTVDVPAAEDDRADLLPDTSTENPTSAVSIETDAATAEFAVICGGTDTGEVNVTAKFSSRPGASASDTPAVEDESFTATKTVVGLPDSVEVPAISATIACDGTTSATVEATVLDEDGNPVVDGTEVRFDVVALGTADPIKAKTTDGKASSKITPLSGAVAGVTVSISAGDAEAQTRVDCSTAGAGGGGGGGGASPTPPGGVIGGPDTGNGGYLAQDGSAGFPLWTLAALALSSVVLIGGGVFARRGR